MLPNQRLDLVFHFVERLEMRFMLVFRADDVETVTALHQIAGLTLGLGKGSLLEFGHSTTAANPTQFATLLRAARVV